VDFRPLDGAPRGALVSIWDLCHDHDSLKPRLHDERFSML